MRSDKADKTDNVLVGGLPDVAELIRARERQEMDKALERARKSALNAYPILGFGDGWFAVPSQSDLGHVYLVQLNVHTGNPNLCTCPNQRPWCTHAAAARIFYNQAREIDDNQRMNDANVHIMETQKKG